jgi:hypothetical protein
MPLINIVFLCITVLAFVAFAITLFWGDMQTRTLAKNAKGGMSRLVS